MCNTSQQFCNNMTINFVIILILALIFHSCSYIIVRTVSSNTLENDRIFLLNRGTAREILENVTVTFLGFDPSNIISMNYSLLSTFHRNNEPVPKMQMEKVVPDECMRVEILKINTLQTRMLYGLKKVGEYINPAILIWKGRYFLGSGLAWGFTAGKPANEHLEFQWLNLSSAAFYSSERFLGISTTIDVIDRVVIGQDPRFVIMDPDKIFVAYTNRFGKHIRMGMAEIVINSSNLANIVNVHETIVPPGFKFLREHNHHQKNWSPFLYNNSILLVQRINPFHVVGLKNVSDPSSEIQSYTVSTAPKLPLKWAYGEIRGGTNAVLIGDVYLAMFHSENHVNGNWLRTYWFGAYTFSAHPPFRILATSPVPIIHDFFYEGAWDPLKNRRIDFCLFPMVISLVNEDEIMVSLGWQDFQGWVAYMNIRTVLASLDPVPPPEDSGK